MESAELEVLIEELEQRVDRLRALYEQYFMGIEKIEPQVLRKDVDRRLWVLRREQIRNTALRFKLNMIVQRYNTFQQYWQRINREIEAGTYKRDVRRVANRFGTDMLTIAAKRRFGRLLERTGVDAVTSHNDDSAFEEIDVELEEFDSMADPTPGLLGDCSQDTEFGTLQFEENLLAAVPPPAEPKAERDPFGNLDDVFGNGVVPLPAPPRPPRVAPPFPAPTRPASTPSSSKPGVPIAVAARPSPSEGARGTDPAPPPDFGEFEGPPSPGTTGVPMLTRRRQSTGPSSFTRPASSPMESVPKLGPPSEPRSRAVPSRVRSPSVPKPSPIAPPSDPGSVARETPPQKKIPARSPPPRKADSAESDLPQGRVRQIYESYVQARRACKESTSNITESGLADMLRASAAKLRSKHVGKSVDFDVVIRDGKAILKPVIKSG